MFIPRKITLLIHFLLDECVPPILRDKKWFMWLPFRLLFGKKAHYFYDFKEQAFGLSEQAFAQVYEETASVHIQRETDLNQPCTERILQDVELRGGGAFWR